MTEFGVPVRLEAGGKGRFDIWINDQHLFSTDWNKRLPSRDEVAEAVRTRLSADNP